MPRLGLVCVDEEHDPVLQAGVGPALRRAHRRRQAGGARGRGRPLRLGDAAPRELGAARADRARRPARRGPPARDRRGHAPRGRLSALRAAARGARARGAGGRQGDPAPEPPRARACAPLPRLRRDPPLRAAATSHSCSTPTGRSAATTAARSQATSELCPACGSPELVRVGAGTQRLERELEQQVPGLERIRLDSDTVAHPAALQKALERFAAADRAVLLGTQMVAKGHHFGDVSLAAVVDADTGLAMPDFRAEERTFQLITQLAGRSGRTAPGRVIVQTFQPDSRAVRLRGAARRRRLPGRGAPPPRGARLSAVPARRAGARLRPGCGRPDAGCSRRSAQAGRIGGRRRDRAGAAPAPPRPPSRAADRQDRRAAPSRLHDRPSARGRGPGDAPCRPPRGRRRRSAEPLGSASRTPGRGLAPWPSGTRRERQLSST